MLVENDYLICEYADINIFINPFTANTGHCKTCVEKILVRSASSERREEVKNGHDSSGIVDPALPYNAWKVICDLSKSVCDAMML